MCGDGPTQTELESQRAPTVFSLHRVCVCVCVSVCVCVCVRVFVTNQDINVYNDTGITR